MDKDKTNLGPEQISVKGQQSNLSMDLPGDGKIHEASGRRPNTSAAHYADAMSRVVGPKASGARPVVKP